MLSPGELQHRIAYAFRDPSLLERALTHKSYAYERRLADHNERMEFLGDAVLNLVVSEHLMLALPASAEGALSRTRAAVVSEASLAAVARTLDLGQYLRLGEGEEQSGGRGKASILADALEAVIASLYLDGGLPAAAGFIERTFQGAIADVIASGGTADHKTALQELCQERLRVLPEYQVVAESGPDHQKQFTVALTIQGVEHGRGTGRSKKEAEQRAAKEAMEKLSKQQP